MALDVDFSGHYINRESIHDSKYILDFIKTKYYSNQGVNSSKIVNSLLKHELVRKHKTKIYAVKLTVMIPTKLNRKDEHELVKQFMLGISPEYKTMCFLYRFMSIGKGRYVEVICFERKLYKKPKEVFVTYKRDMFIDPETGRTVSKDNPSAMQICKKGDFKKDKDGNELKEIIYVSKKRRYLTYKNGKDGNSDERNKNFNNLISRLKGILIQAMSKVLNNVKQVLRLKSKEYKKTFSKSKRIKVLNYNSRINKINKSLIDLQDTFYRKKVLGMEHANAQKDFNRLFYSLVKITEDQQFKVSSTNNYVANISLASHMTFARLNTNLDLFVTVAERKIENWYKTYLPTEYGG